MTEENAETPQEQDAENSEPVNPNPPGESENTQATEIVENTGTDATTGETVEGASVQINQEAPGQDAREEG